MRNSTGELISFIVGAFSSLICLHIRVLRLALLSEVKREWINVPASTRPIKRMANFPMEVGDVKRKKPRMKGEGKKHGKSKQDKNDPTKKKKKNASTTASLKRTTTRSPGAAIVAAERRRKEERRRKRARNEGDGDDDEEEPQEEKRVLVDQEENNEEEDEDEQSE
jgi:hypothetical protein